MRAKQLSNLAIIVSALGCKQSVTNPGPQIPPPFEQITPRDGRFEDVVMLQELPYPNGKIHPMLTIRIDYTLRRAMMSYTHDPRRGDVLVALNEDQPNERSAYLSAIKNQKSGSTTLNRHTKEGNDNILFLEEEEKFNEAYDAWIRSTPK